MIDRKFCKTISFRYSSLLMLCLALPGRASAQGELHFCLRSEPKTFDPLKVEDDAVGDRG